MNKELQVAIGNMMSTMPPMVMKRSTDQLLATGAKNNLKSAAVASELTEAIREIHNRLVEEEKLDTATFGCALLAAATNLLGYRVVDHYLNEDNGAGDKIAQAICIATAAYIGAFSSYMIGSMSQHLESENRSDVFGVQPALGEDAAAAAIAELERIFGQVKE